MKFLDHLEEWFISFLMGGATLLIFVAVVHRYLSGLDSFPWLQNKLLAIDFSWAQELCIFMFVWMCKFGAAYGVRTGIHVGVDVLVNRLPEKSRKKIIVFSLLAGAFFTGVIAVLGGYFCNEMAHTDQVSQDLEAPMWIVYLAIPLGSGLMCFRFLQVAWAFYKTGELPHHDHGFVEGLEDVDSDALHPADLKHGDQA